MTRQPPRRDRPAQRTRPPRPRPAATTERAAPPPSEPRAALAALVALLRQATGRRLQAWRPLLVVVGASLQDPPPGADDVLGFLADAPLKLRSAGDGDRAVRLTTTVAAAVQERLRRGRDVLDLQAPPATIRAYATALGEAIMGLADGLDMIGLDPDALPPPAAAAFERLGRRAAALLELGSALPGGDDRGARAELDAARAATEQDVRELYAAGPLRPSASFVPLNDLESNS